MLDVRSFFSFPVSYYLWLNIHILECVFLAILLTRQGHGESKDWGLHCIEVYLCISGLINLFIISFNVLQKFASQWVNFHTSYFENESFWNRVFHLGPPWIFSGFFNFHLFTLHTDVKFLVPVLQILFFVFFFLFFSKSFHKC